VLQNPLPQGKALLQAIVRLCDKLWLRCRSDLRLRCSPDLRMCCSPDLRLWSIADPRLPLLSGAPWPKIQRHVSICS